MGASDDRPPAGARRVRTFNTMREVLDVAVAEEEKAAAFYRVVAAAVAAPVIRFMLEGFATEEDGHARKLREVLAGRTVSLPRAAPVEGLRIAEYVVPANLTPDLRYPDVLKLAMLNEKNAFRMYTALAEAATDPNLRWLLQCLAAEEARHKLRFELEYESHLFRDRTVVR